MANFHTNQGEFHFWDDMWNKSNEKKNEKDITEDGVEDTPLEP